jgi:hypothetical protein
MATLLLKKMGIKRMIVLLGIIKSSSAIAKTIGIT